LTPPLLAVPNVSEGRDPVRIEALGQALAEGASLLDRHSDPDHNRTVFSLAGEPGPLGEALARGAATAIESVDMGVHDGVHPAIGALDVCPLVWLDRGDREAARSEAIAVAERIGALGVPVFFYGELASGPERVERAWFRSGGLAELWLRMEGGGLRSDRGPDLPHRSAGATLVTARPPLAAFNIELDSGDPDIARAVAAGLRESGGGPAGVRALGLPLSSGRTQVSTNVHDPLTVPLVEIVERVRTLAAPLSARPIEAELVGLVPAAALSGYPDDVPIRDFDPALQTIERRLQSAL
jgi:glutamate formiminotransferase/glutamate formiminotransferase/formiminotetrahydrofolate cyclodeaminase